MRFHRRRIVDYLRSIEEHDKAQQAESWLPAQVDTERDVAPLRDLGFSIQQPAASARQPVGRDL